MGHQGAAAGFPSGQLNIGEPAKVKDVFVHKLLLTPIVVATAVALTAGCCHSAAHHQPVAFELDDQFRPCDDFASYVNAKWNAANPIPDDQTSWGAFSMLADQSRQQQREILVDAATHAGDGSGDITDKLGNLWAAGMDTDTINKLGYDPIKPLLAAVDALAAPADVVDFIDTRYSEGDGYVFSFGSGADFKDATRQIGYVEQSGLGLPSPDYYTAPKYAEIRQQYLGFITTTLTLTGTPAAEAAHQADQVLALETDLAKASLSPTELRDLDNQYNLVTVAAADAVSPHFSWGKFFAAQGVDVASGFSLSQPKFIAEFDRLLASAPIDQWRAYLRFNVIAGSASALSQPFQDAVFEFYGKTLNGQPQQKERWKKVVGAVNGAMGMGLGQLYVAKYFPPQAKARAEELVTNVREALKHRIENLTWMSADTKKKALEKWALFLPKIGYPDDEHWRDWSGLRVVPGQWYASLQAAGKYNYRYDISQIGGVTDRKEWGMTPQTVNAYYSPSTNTINFPAAVLQAPFFDPDADDAVNYGGIGWVIGHESSHGFDDQGSEFDGYGNRVDWWTEQDKQQFDERTGALVRQFDAYAPIPGKPDLHVNGELTLGENIADLGGLNIAYDALQATQPEEQDAVKRFFLSSARIYQGSTREQAAEVGLNTDPHSPDKIRAFASATNMPAFATAFGCKPGDPMVHTGAQLVTIW